MSIRLSSKLLLTAGPYSDGGTRLFHWCPGCRNMHLINVQKPNRWNAVWRWNGNVEKPTFGPSVNMPGVCHYFIVDGNIQFCSDCSHTLAGQTVPLPDVPQMELDDWLDDHPLPELGKVYEGWGDMALPLRPETDYLPL